jgi:hypothetical protein
MKKPLPRKVGETGEEEGGWAAEQQNPGSGPGGSRFPAFHLENQLKYELFLLSQCRAKKRNQVAFFGNGGAKTFQKSPKGDFS